VIPVGNARLTIKVTDADGKPVRDARIRTLVMMPGMPMGEKETAAVPVGGIPGTYSTDASFMMAGAYDASLKIEGPSGSATGKLTLETGQDTGHVTGGFTPMHLVPWILSLALAIFIVARIRATGQQINLKPLASRGTIGGLALIAAIFAVSLYAISHWRRPGA